MRSEERKLENIIRLMQSDNAIDAPADAIKYAKNVFKMRAAEQPASLVQKIMAVLHVDIAPGQLAFGERSAAEAQARQMLFEAGDNAVDLRITAGTSGYDVRGQILGDGFTAGQVTLSNDEGSTTVEISEIGDFKLTGLPAGEFNLNIRNDDREISIEHVTLR